MDEVRPNKPCDEDKRMDRNGEAEDSTAERLIFKDVESFDSL
ncbi:MAG: hypothetical protein QXW47_00635 [Candidatus Jordarchaeales archaeon]